MTKETDCNKIIIVIIVVIIIIIIIIIINVSCWILVLFKGEKR
jgi:uncharacterized integral membrane protein